MAVDGKYTVITDSDRICFEDVSGRIIAEIDFPEVRPGVVNIVHTGVDPVLRGQGIAEKLTMEAAKLLRTENRKAVLSCSYAVKWFSKHPEYSDVLEDPASEARKAEQFGGPACGISSLENNV